MSITRHTKTQLIVEENPWLLASALLVTIFAFVGLGVLLALNGDLLIGMMFGGAGLILGGGIFALAIERVQAIFDATMGTVTLRRRNSFRYVSITHDLADVAEAIVETTQGRKGTLYRLSLALDRGMSEGIHPLRTAYSNTGNPRKIARAINDWLKTARERHKAS